MNIVRDEERILQHRNTCTTVINSLATSLSVVSPMLMSTTTTARLPVLATSNLI